MRDLVCIFPDTNLFLHYPPLKDIDWCKLADAKSVKLVICMTVIHELDDKKSDSRLSGRATRAIKEIRGFSKSGQEIRSGVNLVVFNREVSVSEFPSSLSPDSADDRIVHLAKCYASEIKEPVAIASGDFGMELRAEAGGVEIVSLDEVSRLENPLDEHAKKLRETQKELSTLKHRLPRLSLRFEAQKGTVALPHEVTFELDGESGEIDVAREIDRLRDEHPHQVIEQNHYIANFHRDRWAHYNSKLDAFYEKSREHFEFVNVINAAKARSFWFDLWITNDGNGIATDIDAYLRFPDSIQLVAESGTKKSEPLEEKLLPPKPPAMPDLSDLIYGLGGERGLIPTSLNLPDLTKIHRLNEWEPEITISQYEDDCYEIHARLGKLKHGHEVRLGKFVVLFGAPEWIRPFSADTSISTTDLPNEQKGKLPFIVKRKDEHSSE